MRRAAFVSWLLVTFAAQAQFPFGHSTPVNGYAPELHAEPLWLGNPAYGYHVKGGPPGGSAFIAISAGRQDQLVGGLQVYLDMNALVTAYPGTLDASGRVSFDLPLGMSDNPALTGVQLMAQAAVDDPTTPGALATTQAVMLEVTLHPMLAYCNFQGTIWLRDLVYAQTTTVAGLPQTAVVREMTFANAGRDLLVAASTGVYLVDTLSPGLVAVPIAAGAWTDIAWDKVHHRAYAVSSASIAVIEGDRTSPAFGTVLFQAPDTGNTSIAVSTDGGMMALAAATPVVSRRVADPANPSYLQVIPTPAIPGFLPSPVEVGPVHLSPDGRIVSLPLRVTTTLPPSSAVHRFDSASGAWIDHNPAPGYQPLANPTYPAVPLALETHFAPEGGSLLLSGGAVVAKADLSFATPANVTVTPTAAQVFGAQYLFIGVTRTGRFMVQRQTPPFGVTPASLWLVSIVDGQWTILSTFQSALGTLPAPPVIAWR
jgi:hypothetical protein